MDFFQKYGALPIILPIIIGLGLFAYGAYMDLVVAGNLLIGVMLNCGHYLLYGFSAGLVPVMVANIFAGSIGARKDNAITKCNKEKANQEIYQRALNGMLFSADAKNEIIQRYQLQSPIIDKNPCAPSLTAEFLMYKQSTEGYSNRKYTKGNYFNLLSKREKAETRLAKASKVANVFNKGLWVLPLIRTLFCLAMFSVMTLPVFSLVNAKAIACSIATIVIPTLSYSLGYITRSIAQRRITKFDKKIEKAEFSLGINKVAELKSLDYIR